MLRLELRVKDRNKRLKWNQRLDIALVASTRLIECGALHFTALEPFLEENGRGSR